MYSNKRYIDRLINQWREHGSLILAVDYDDTLVAGNVNSDEDLKSLRDLLKRAVDNYGFKIVIFTARNKKYFEDIVKTCADYKLDICAINEDIVQVSEPTSGKIYYNLLFDDKAGLEQAFNILEETLEMIDIFKQLDHLI